MDGLLEASDVRFKEELASVVDLNAWKDGLLRIKTRQKKLSEQSIQLRGMEGIRADDLSTCLSDVQSAERVLGDVDSQLQEELLRARADQNDPESLREAFHLAESAAHALDEERLLLRGHRDQTLSRARSLHADAARYLDSSARRLRRCRGLCDGRALAVRRAGEALSRTQTALRDLDRDLDSRCPTCLQPLDHPGEERLRESLGADLHAARSALSSDELRLARADS